MLHFEKLILASIAVTGLLANSAKADYFNLAQDFSIASNPNGVWTYGYATTLGGALTLNTTSGASLRGSGLEYWQTNLALDVPIIGYNPSGSVVTSYATLVIQPGQAFFHPGPQDQFETARFTAPKSKALQLTTGFAGIDVVGTTSDVHVLLNGKSLFSGLINGYGATQSYSSTIQFNAGDTLDFSVGYGSNSKLRDSPYRRLVHARGRQFRAPTYVHIMSYYTADVCRR